MNKKIQNIVTIGGGTGSYMLLSALKKIDNVNITAIVAMSDSGGSTGILRDQMGVLPAGDIRQCLVALSETEEILRKLFTYRYDKSFLKGHTFGNIFLSTIENISGSFEKSIAEASKILNIRGKILPITLNPNDLVVELKNSKKIIGEGKIDHSNIKNYKKIYLKNKPKLNPKITKALKEADIIIVAPGNFYNSIIPNFLIKGFAKKIKKSKAKTFFISNLATKGGHTDDFKITDFIDELYKLSGERDFIDYVIYNKNQKLDKKVLKAYKKAKSKPIFGIDGKKFLSCQFLGANVLSNKKISVDKNDKIKRSFLRHNGEKLINIILQIVDRKKLYIFDFDHTLFNARKQKEDISKLLSGHKNMISEEIWKEYQNKNKELLNFMLNKTDKYLFKNSIKILKGIKGKKILLSVGDEEYQKTKINASGLPSLFDEVIILQKDKVKYMKKIYKENKDKEIIFINDAYNKRYNENKDLKKFLPNIKIIEVDPYKDKNLNLLKNLI